MKKNNHHRIGTAYLEFDITLKNGGNSFNSLDVYGNIVKPFWLVIKYFAYAFSIATPNTTAGKEIEINKHFDRFSTSTRFLTSKDRDFLSYFDKIFESQKGIKVWSLIHMFININVMKK